MSRPYTCTCGGRPAGTRGVAGAFSFYPTKNLGALGDGGAVVTDDDGLARAVRRLRNYGEDSKYVNVTPGFNSRLQRGVREIRPGAGVVEEELDSGVRVRSGHRGKLPFRDSGIVLRS